MKTGKQVLSILLSLVIVLSFTFCTVSASAATRFPEYYTADLVQPESSDEVVEAKVKALVNNMTADEKWSFIHGSGLGQENGDAGTLPGVPRFGVPEFRMHDGPCGLYYVTPTTNPPQEEMLAATWDEEMAKLYGSIYSTEAKAMGAGAMLSAQVDIQRNPQFGRTKDQMGEDPYLLSHLADDLVQGMQSEGGVAVLKHFTGMSDEAFENDEISEQALHELYLPGFEYGVKNGKALGLMSSYNAVNGTHTANSSYLQNQILRNQWGYKYFTVTDWGAGNRGYSIDKGTDIEMPLGIFNNKVMAQIKSGSDTMRLINQSVTRILRAYGKAGYLTLVKVGTDGKPLEEKGRTERIKSVPISQAEPALRKLSDENSDKAQQIAEAGAVLLKNKGNALPVSKNETVGVVGYAGMNPISGVGGERSNGTVSQMSSTYAQLVKQLGAENVKGTPYKDETGTTIPNSVLYTDKTGSQHGLVRTYGIDNLHSSTLNAEVMQGAGVIFDYLSPVINNLTKKGKTGMPGHEYGEKAGIDPVLHFTTGTRNGKPNGTYHVSEADPGTANAFPYSEKPAYTWEGYIEAPEDGEYTISYQSIGGLAEIHIYDTDGTTELASINSTAGSRQGAQWHDSLSVTPTGMNIVSKTVNLKKGQRYKIHAEAMYSNPEKDLQVGLSWVTPSQKKANQENAARYAKSQDKVLIFVYAPVGGGISNLLSKPSKESLSLKLPQEQVDMINKTAAAAHTAGKKAIVVLNTATAVVMNDWINNVDGLLQMYYPGQRGGQATANLLTGKVNPSGKLAFTIPKSDNDTVITTDEGYANYRKGNLLNLTDTYIEGINTGYKYLDEKNLSPQFAFGYGLSYTKFEYSDLKVKSKPAKGERYGYDVTFKVKNVGDRTGSETTELYLGKANVPNGIQTSKKALKGFYKVKDLKPGKTRKVKIHIGQRELSYWNSNSNVYTKRADGTYDKWTVAKGPRTVYVGPASNNLPLKTTIDVK